MPKQDPQAPATKQDIAMLMQEIGKLYDANERWKDDLHDDMERWRNELRGDVERWKEEVKLHFDAAAENLAADFRGALSDKIDQHENRIARLEKHAGLRS